MPRYKLTIAYDGTEFCGWQKQEPIAPGEEEPHARAALLRHTEPGLEPGAKGRVALRTVQAVVERAVREIVREPVDLKGASRTDSGVHARGQVAAFTCSGEQTVPGGEGTDDTPTHRGWPASRGLDRLRRAINGRLPDDVQVVGVEVVHDAFDPISDCVSKGYSYTLHVSPPPPGASGLKPLWDRRYCLHVWHELDVARMREAGAVLVGEHDYAAFAAAGHGKLSTVRTVHALDIVEVDPASLRAAGLWVEGSRRLRIEISGSGFLYNMVRIIAGTLVEVGRGAMTRDDVARALASKDRRLAGPTLPPEGLCLEWVRFA